LVVASFSFELLKVLEPSIDSVLKLWAVKEKDEVINTSKSNFLNMFSVSVIDTQIYSVLRIIKNDVM